MARLGADIDISNEAPQGGSPITQSRRFFPSSRIHAIDEKLGFSRKNAEIGRKTRLSRNHACLWMISRNHAHFSTLSRITHASRFTQSRKNKIVFTQSRTITQQKKANNAITQTYGGASSEDLQNGLIRSKNIAVRILLDDTPYLLRDLRVALISTYSAL